MASPEPTAPEAYNAEQDDAPAQAQTVADDARARAGDPGDDATTKPRDGAAADDGGTPDLVDTMNQMVSSGRIDMGAFAGERSDDDETGTYGEDADPEDDFPHGAQ